VKKLRNKVMALVITAAAAFSLTACTDDDATVVSENISKDADNFKILRKVVVFNGITDQYLLTVEGFCNIVDEENQLEITCKVGDDRYTKDFAGLSDNVSYFVKQVQGAKVSKDHYKVTFKPSTVIPDIEVR
jgi:hypothetical protein